MWLSLITVIIIDHCEDNDKTIQVMLWQLTPTEYNICGFQQLDFLVSVSVSGVP